jgi:hypothetical protein
MYRLPYYVSPSIKFTLSSVRVLLMYDIDNQQMSCRDCVIRLIFSVMIHVKTTLSTNLTRSWAVSNGECPVWSLRNLAIDRPTLSHGNTQPH